MIGYKKLKRLDRNKNTKQTLYKDLASVYEAMYQTFINYEEEYLLYSDLIKKYNKKHLLELGSGTGNLAAYFIKNGFEYSGLDYSQDMIAIAKTKLPKGTFLEGDMRNFTVTKPVEAILMAGRTISYLLKNEDVQACFTSVHNNLQEKGIFCFDFIDANRFIPLIFQGKEITHEAIFEGTSYIRESTWDLNLKNGMDFNWQSTYFKKASNKLIEIGQDDSTIRTFSINELEIFLAIQQFKIREVIEKASYAFPTYVIVAEKISNQQTSL